MTPHVNKCLTSPQPVRPKEASDSVSTIRDVMPLTTELAVYFSLHTQCKRCSTGTYIQLSFPRKSFVPQWDEASVSKIVCSCTSLLRTPALHHGVPRISTIFVLLRLNQLGQKKLPVVFPLSGMLCLWPLSSQCASPYTLNVSTELQAFTKPP